MSIKNNKSQITNQEEKWFILDLNSKTIYSIESQCMWKNW